MNMIWRDDAGDTGEQDVRELRRAYEQIREAKPDGDLVDVGPFVRNKEDVPHEGAIPDFYGLPDDTTDGQDHVEDELLQMVEAGELCFGWLEDRGEFGFWFPEEKSATAPDPTPEPAPVAAAPVRRSHRRVKERTIGHKILLGVAASLAAPLTIGVAAYAADHGQRPPERNWDSPDLAAEATTNPPPSDKPNMLNYQTSQRVIRADAAAPAPTVTVTATVTASPSAAKHAKAPAASQGAEVFKEMGPGRHRKTDDASAEKKQKPHHHHKGHHKAKDSAQAKDSDSGKRQGPVPALVTSILAPVGDLLG